MAKKQRLDLFLVEKGFFTSREKAKTTIMAGVVFINGQKLDKPGTEVPVDAEVKIQGNPLPYVSRGGLKLEKAIKDFNIELTNKVMMDIGASTGGFTDCALQNGAQKVYAVDVGYGQLDWKLRTNEKVINLERTNIRNLQREQIQEAPEFISIDVAFISLDKVLPKAYELLEDNGQIVALIKPQFEAGREKVGKKGVVRDPLVHQEVINKVIGAAKELGLIVLDLAYSPIRGPEGNIEYLIHLLKANIVDEDKMLNENTIINNDNVTEIVTEANNSI